MAKRSKSKTRKTSREVLSWPELEDLFNKIVEALPDKNFVEKMLRGSFSVAKDKSNEIRGNILASILRELITYSLHSLAPDKQIKKCFWFELQPNTDGPTRAQRAQFITQAGLSDSFVERELKINPRSVRKPISEIMNKLNKNVHVKPATLLADDQEIRSIATDCLLSLIDLFDSSKICRAAIEEAVIDQIDETIADKLIFDVIDNLDELSTHTSVESHDIDQIEIIDIDHEFIYFEVTGSVNVDLQYGSNSDVRNDIGHVVGDAYPYTASLQSKVTRPLYFLADDVDVNVDTGSFYE